MNRRENLKLLLTGASGFLLTGCEFDSPQVTDSPRVSEFTTGGRSPEEIAHDEKLQSATFFTDKEMEKLNYLVEVIIPEDEESIGALEAGVPDFIEFMMKDIPAYQTRMRGGLMWLDNYSTDRFDRNFMELDQSQRISVLDEIAYPDKARPEVSVGVGFFNLLRDLTATGFYTSEAGITYLDYRGNRPNVWNGVPANVMAIYNVSNDAKYEPYYLQPEKRGVLAQWDDEGNLV